jgi:hypothetical protein
MTSHPAVIQAVAPMVRSNCLFPVNSSDDMIGFSARVGWDPVSALSYLIAIQFTILHMQVTGLGTPDFLKLQPLVLNY